MRRSLLPCLAAASLWSAAEGLLWSQPFTFTTLAGNAGYGSADGVGTSARFDFPEGVAVDGNGNVYVADTENSMIRKITPGGQVSTLAGVAGMPGSADTAAGGARFSHPQGVGVDAAGNVYVADTRNSTVRMITPGGVVSTLAGSPGVIGSADGTNGDALFNLPGAVAADAAGNLYVADTYNSTVRMLAPSGSNWVVTTLAGSTNVTGNLDGTNTSARFYRPSGIAVDANRNLYVADTGNSAIRRITPMGSNWVTTTIAHLSLPSGIAVDGAGSLYVAASSDNTIRELSLLGTNWVLSTVAGLAGAFGSADGLGTNASFNYPHGIAATTSGVLYVADSLNNTIRQITTAGVVSTFAGLAGGPGDDDGSQSLARFSAPLGVAVDAGSNVYVADSQNNTIRMIAPGGVVSTLAGVATNFAGSADGFGTNASFNLPAAVSVDASTNVYVADFFNNEIRKLTPTGTNWMVATVAGRSGSVYYGLITNVVGTATNVSTAFSDQASFVNYSGLVTNVAGGVTNVSVIITNVPTVTALINGVTNIIQLATNGFTLGSAPQALDGTGADALFYQPSGLALDSLGNLYVADGGTNGVRFITPAGAVTTLPGSTGAYVVDPNVFGTNQLYFHSTAVAVDGATNVFVSDKANNTVRMLTPAGTNWAVATIAGSPGFYGIADGTNAVARFASPTSIALDAQGNLYVADAFSHTLRKVAPVGTNWVVTTVAGAAGVSGSVDGPGADARFNDPSGIAVDSAGNLYVADTGNNTIRFGQAAQGSVGSAALQISLAGGQVIVAWPASAAAAGFALETSLSLGADASWQGSTNMPVASGLSLAVTNAPGAGATFYRLRKP
jgi:sugar lactone lactonase YvrE